MDMFLKAAKIDNALVKLFVETSNDTDGMEDVDAKLLETAVFDFINKTSVSSRARFFDILTAK